MDDNKSFSYRNMPPTPKSPEKRDKQRGTVPTTAAVLITILVAVVAFTAGTRLDDYSAFSGLLGNDEGISDELPADLDYTSVEQVYDRLRVKYDGMLSEDDLLNGLKIGLAEAAGDPYTVYLTTEQSEQFKDDLNGTFTGIGAEIGIENEVLVIVAPLDGFPAQQVGLRAGDAIIKIDDEDAVGLSVEEAVLKIRGPEDTDVKLTVIRNSEQLEFTITRQKIVVPSVATEVNDGIGYLRISRFAEDTTELAREAAQQFVDQNVSGVILDLRNNSGGFLSSAVDITSLWIENQPVVQERDNNGENVVDTLNAGRNAILKDMPTMVLVNSGSASASEIVAGALQDYEAATLIGTTTYGKGSVQSLENFNDGSTLKVTIARWYTPDGRNIDEDGIQPDIEVELSEEDIEDERDTQRRRAEQELKN